MTENGGVIKDHPLIFLCDGSPELLILPKGAQVFPNVPTTTAECKVVLVEKRLSLDELTLEGVKKWR
jgi:hypothetical protein